MFYNCCVSDHSIIEPNTFWERMNTIEELDVLVDNCYEHEDQPNLAFQRNTQLSSTFDSHVSSKAVDGSDNPTLSFGSCASADETDVNPWLMINLGSEQRITTVVVTNKDTHGRSYFSSI